MRYLISFSCCDWKWKFMAFTFEPHEFSGFQSWIIDLVICQSVEGNAISQVGGRSPRKLIMLGMQLCVPSGEKVLRKAFRGNGWNDNLEQRKLNTFSCNIFLKNGKLFAKCFQRLHSSAGEHACSTNVKQFFLLLQTIVFSTPLFAFCSVSRT